jgi:heme oxygenase (biliverdin-IX-beta and delta-forming)
MSNPIDVDQAYSYAIPLTGSLTTEDHAGAHRPILERLRVETAPQHRALEAHIPLLDSGLTVAVYAELIARFWGYYAPLERRLLLLADRLFSSFDYALRLKTPLLLRDLDSFGKLGGRLPRCRNVPALATMPEVLGCLYVLEGSTLGGQVISRRLHNHLGLTRDSGAAFFTGYGAATARRWRSFGTFLTDTARTLDHDELIVSGAVDTFETLKTWLAPA